MIRDIENNGSVRCIYTTVVITLNSVREVLCTVFRYQSDYLTMNNHTHNIIHECFRQSIREYQIEGYVNTPCFAQTNKSHGNKPYIEI